MLSICMLVYDNNASIAPMTMHAVTRVLENTTGPFELILVLNGPSSLQTMGLDERVIPVPLEQRTGIAEAYNRGFSVASGDFYCCLHNDVGVGEGWNIPLMEEAQKGNIAFPHVDESMSNCEKYRIGRTKEYQPTGCCFIMHKDLWDMLGGYDEQFKEMHWEDMDMFIRARRMGARLKRVDVTVSHGRGGTRRYCHDVGMGALIVNRARWIRKNMPYSKDGRFYYAVLDEYEDSWQGYKEFVNAV